MHSSQRMDPLVEALLNEYGHPLRKEIDVLRGIILSTDQSIQEGVKWNTASFRTSEWFATLNGPKQTKYAMIILHAGVEAKGKDLSKLISDPDKMLEWRGNERAILTLSSLDEITAKKNDIKALISAWIKYI